MVMNKQEPVVYIIDDEFVIRDSLTLLLESAGHTVKSYASAEDFLDGFNPTQPGCLILDVKMPVMSGLELQEELVRRMVNIPIIFMSGNSEIPDTVKALKAGAVDFLEKPFGNDVLQGLIKEAIEKDIRNKEKNLGQAVLQQRIARLTPREKEVLTLVVKSHSNKEAARILNVSHRTIDVHRARIMEKMQAQDIAELVTIAMQCGVVV